VANRSTPAATTAVDAFARKSDAGAFWVLHRADIARGLKARLADPDIIHQRDSPYCGPACTIRAICKDDPDAYATAATDLYDTGVGKVKDLELKPGSELLKSPVKMNMDESDWLMLATLRDTSNAVLSPAGAVGDSLAGITVPSTILAWAKAAGYTNQESNTYLTNLSKPVWDRAKKMMAIARRSSDLKALGYHVFLLIDANMLDAATQNDWTSTYPDHWVALEGNIVAANLDDRDSAVTANIWTWGGQRGLAENAANPVSLGRFTNKFYGFVAIKRRSAS
jgi:hypothetical protein